MLLFSLIFFCAPTCPGYPLGLFSFPRPHGEGRLILTTAPVLLTSLKVFFSRSSVFKLASCRSQSFSLISQSLHHARRHTHALSRADTPVPAKRSKDKGQKVEAMSRRQRDETWSYRRTDQSPRVFSNAASLTLFFGYWCCNKVAKKRHQSPAFRCRLQRPCQHLVLSSHRIPSPQELHGYKSSSGSVGPPLGLRDRQDE